MEVSVETERGPRKDIRRKGLLGLVSGVVYGQTFLSLFLRVGVLRV